MMKLKKFLYWLVCCILIIVILVLSRENYLPVFGKFLVVQDELRPADVAIVLGGEEERIMYAVKLYRKNMVKFIVVTDGQFSQEQTIAGWMSRKAVRAGIPAERILLEPKAQHTYQHPIFVKPILQEHGFTSAIVVSSPYHMRRSKMLFDRAFRKSGISLIYSPVAHSWFSTDRWWKSQDGRRIVLGEYIKLAVNVWGVKVSEWACTLLKEKNWSILVTR